MLGAVDDASWAEGQTLWVAVSVTVHVAPWRGVVRRHSAVEVESQDFAVEAAQVLAARPSVSHISCGHQQGVVGQDQQTAAVVDAACRQRQQHFFVDQRSAVPIEHGKTLRAAPCRTCRVHDEHLGGGFPFGMHRHAQHAGLPTAIVGDRTRQHRAGGARLRIDSVHCARAAGDPKEIVRAPQNFPRQLDARSNVRGGQRGVTNLKRVLAQRGIRQRKQRPNPHEKSKMSAHGFGVQSFLKYAQSHHKTLTFSEFPTIPGW